MYRFSPHVTTEVAATWLTDAAADDLYGDLSAALDLAAVLDCDVQLKDAAGFRRGLVHADGTYSLQ